MNNPKFSEFNRLEHEEREARLRDLGLRGEPHSDAVCLFCQNPLPPDRRHELFCIVCESN